MSASRQGRSISERSREIKKSLRNLKDQIDKDAQKDQPPIRSDAIEDILDRYLLWTGNLGALHEPTNKLSLDCRLLAAPEIRDQICEFLDDLQEAVDDLMEISLGNHPNRELHTPNDSEGAWENEIGDSSSESSHLDEAQSLLEIISQCIRSLFRIGVLVRKASPRDRFQRALQHSESAFPAWFDIDYVRHKYPKLCRPDSRELAERLGSANAKRRQYIKYCRDHKTRLGRVTEESLPAPGGDQEEDLEDGTTAKLSSKATTLLPFGSSELAKLESNVAEEEDAVSFSTASTTFESAMSLTLPSLEELSPDSEPFECPICFTLQSFRREKAWKFHAFSDLKAYVCTVGGQGCANELFRDRNTWFDHELLAHRSKYICPLCSEDVGGKASLALHVESSHGNFAAEQISMLAEAGRVVPNHFEAQDCPFCDEWAEVLKSKRHGDDKSLIHMDDHMLVSRSRFKRHVATHQEQLAIFVVPKSSEDAEDAERVSMGSAKSESLGSGTEKDVLESTIPTNEVDLEPPTTKDDPSNDLIKPEFSDIASTAQNPTLEPESVSKIRVDQTIDVVVEDTSPSICFSPFYNMRKPNEPILPFAPIFRRLPTGREVVKVGRYSERKKNDPASSNTPTVDPVGFKTKVVSRRHCEFWFEDGQWYMKDVKSSSGTFLNHIRLSAPGTESKPLPINDGDIVQLGINFKGGQERIYRCVRMRIELNKGPPRTDDSPKDAHAWCKEQGMDVSNPSFRFDHPDPITGVIPVHLAIRQEDTEVLRLMLQHKLDLEQRDTLSMRALHVAAYMCNRDICELLLYHYASVDALDGNGMTPLHECQSSWGGVGAAEAILEHSPDLINRPDHSGRTALYIACEKGNDTMVKFLLSAKADPNSKGPNDRTPLMVAIAGDEDAGAASRRLHIVELLLSHGADPGLPDVEGRTALMAADELGMNDIKKLLESAHSGEEIHLNMNEPWDNKEENVWQIT
ncbi:hypothetical protein F5Y13DRAFT_189354 [Hypoxylon sp. FL1857]|nr:hypothetical protein F5Y13DRAFT_189354 [Hypoxylon sp. FL1857]